MTIFPFTTFGWSTVQLNNDNFCHSISTAKSLQGHASVCYVIMQ